MEVHRFQEVYDDIQQIVKEVKQFRKTYNYLQEDNSLETIVIDFRPGLENPEVVLVRIVEEIVDMPGHAYISTGTINLDWFATADMSNLEELFRMMKVHGRLHKNED